MAETSIGKRDGKVRFEDYVEVQSYLEKLEPIVSELNKSQISATDAKQLALLTCSIQQFQEDALGKTAKPPKPFPKLPSQLFRDLSPNGGLYMIASKLTQLKEQMHISQIDFSDEKLREQNITLLRHVRDDLVHKGAVKIPNVFIHPDCGEKIPQLKEVVLKLHGKVIESAEDTSITHEVHPNTNKESDPVGEYLRCVQVSGPNCFVHWWYLPDSYDEWLPADYVSTDDMQPDPELPTGVSWKVQQKWLTDSDIFNEWMNPYDYVTKQFEQFVNSIVQKKQNAGKRKHEQGAPAGTGGDAVPVGADVNEAKRLRVAGEIIEGEGVRQQYVMTKQVVAQVNKKVLDNTATVENISRGQQIRIPNVSQPPKHHPAQHDKSSACSKVVVPMHSHWFKFKAVHDVERRAVPDFFTGEFPHKTPDVYVQYRDFMVAKYRENVAKYLSYSDARSYLTGDVNAIHQVWSFLSTWGIINHQAHNTPSQTNTANTDPSQHPQTLISTLKSTLKNPYQDKCEKLYKLGKGGVKQGLHATTTGGGIGTVKNKDGGSQKIRYFCNAMPWVDVSECRYHCVKYPDIDLCAQAYADGKFPPGTNAKDFIKIVANRHQSQKDWSEEETLLLLEGLELHGDRWEDIAEHVGTRTQADCLQHFLALPIEQDLWAEYCGRKQGDKVDAVLFDVPKSRYRKPPGAPDGIVPRDTWDDVDDDEWDDVLPFADTSNPVMAQIAFLTAMVGPKVASAAAQGALEALAVEDEKNKKDGEGSKGGGGKEGAGQGNAGGEEKGIVVNGGQQKEEEGGQEDGVAVGGVVKEERVGNGFSARQMRVAAAKGLAAAAVKAKVLALEEERVMYRLVAKAVTAQMKKLQLKLRQVTDMEAAIRNEKARVIQLRQTLVKEREVLLAERERLRNLAGDIGEQTLDALPELDEQDIEMFFGDDDEARG